MSRMKMLFLNELSCRFKSCCLRKKKVMIFSGLLRLSYEAGIETSKCMLVAL